VEGRVLAVGVAEEADVVARVGVADPAVDRGLAEAVVVARDQQYGHRDSGDLLPGGVDLRLLHAGVVEEVTGDQ
jgi:hypothetical protein